MPSESLIKIITSVVKRLEEKYPQTAVVRRIDGNLATIQIDNSPSFLRNVPVVGDPNSIAIGQTVSIRWEEREGAAGLVPVIITEGGGGASGSFILSNLVPDEITITNTPQGLSVKPGSIGLSHLNFVPALAGHTHEDSLTAFGWKLTEDGILYTNAVQISPKGSIVLGDAAGSQIFLDGPGRSIRSSDFASGLRGFDINVSSGDAEFNNVRVRGELVSTVFRYNEIAATAGTLGAWYSASELWQDFTSPSALEQDVYIRAKNTVEGVPRFGVGSKLHIKSLAVQGSALNDITYVASSAFTWSGNEVFVDKLPQALVGDLAIVQLTVRGSGATTSPPSGWNQLLSTLNTHTNNLRSVVFWKRITSDEPSSYRFAFSAAMESAGSISVWRNVDETGPFNATSSRVNARSTSLTADPVTTTTDKAMLLWLGATDEQAEVAPPSGMTEIADTSNNGGSSAAAYAVQAAAGSSGVKTGGLSGPSGLNDITLVGSNSYYSGTGVTSAVFNNPGVQEGDVMLVAVTHSAGPTVTMSGWTQLAEQANSYSGSTFVIRIFAKVAGPSEPDTYTMNFSTARGYAAGICAFRNAQAPEVLHGGVGEVSDNTIESGPAANVEAGDAVLFLAAARTHLSNIMTPPGSMSELWDRGNGNASLPAYSAGAWILEPSAGASGPHVATLSTNAYSTAFLVRLRPSGTFTGAYSVGQLIALKPSTKEGSGFANCFFDVTEVTSNEGEYTKYRCKLKYGTTGATFVKGTAIADYGPAGKGFITLSADDAVGYSPNITLATHAGAPWSTITLIGRIGNVRGSYGCDGSTTRYGFGLGDYTSGNYLSYNAEAANTFVLSAANKAVRIDPSGLTMTDTSATISRVGNLNGTYGYTSVIYGAAFGKWGTNQANITIDATNGLRVRQGTTDRLKFDMSGNATMSGVFSIAASGGFWLGSAGSFASPNTGLKMWFDGSIGRFATYSSGQLKVQIDTLGRLNAGPVLLDHTGQVITVTRTGSYSPTEAIRFMTGGGQLIGGLYGVDNASHYGMYLYTDTSGTFDTSSIQIWSRSGYYSTVDIRADSSGKTAQIRAQINELLQAVINISSESCNITAPSGLWISHNCSALSFTDRTPYPENTQEAYEAVMSVARLPEGEYQKDDRAKQTDHARLHPFIKADGGRDLSALVSAQNEVIKDLINRIQALEASRGKHGEI